MASQSNEILICPNCQYPNEKTAENCGRCGTPLLRTIPVATQLIEPGPPATRQADKAPVQKPSPGAMTLIVAGYAEPFVIRKQGDIVLGRRMPNESAPTVDMTKYNGHLLGVSRRHAVISFKDEGYTLEDFNSTNGTWVNENKLRPNQPYPLQGGDQVRLGNLIMFVYFSAVTSLYLEDPQQAAFTSSLLTPRYLEQNLGPYLNALMEVQHVVDSILERPLSDIIIRSITSGPKNVIQVKLDGTMEAVKLAKEQVDPKKRERSIKTRPHEATPPADPSDSHPSKPVREDQIRLAQTLVSKVKPTLTGDQAVEYSQKLLGPLRILIDSSLEISDAPHD
jgi:hypothetical protein